MNKTSNIVALHINQRSSAKRYSAFKDDLSTVVSLAAKADGFLSSSVICGRLPGAKQISVLIQFESWEHFQRWRGRDVVVQAIGKLPEYSTEPTVIKIAEGPSNSFDFSADPVAVVSPPKWKMAIVSWLAIFPILTVSILVTGPLLSNMHLIGRLFVNTLLIAPLMTWLAMPLMMRLFRGWLFGQKAG